METVQDMYRKMILFNTMERILFQAQRQVCLIHLFQEKTCYILEVIIDYGSPFVTYGKITETKIESKGVQFPGWDAPDKINRGG